MSPIDPLDNQSPATLPDAEPVVVARQPVDLRRLGIMGGLLALGIMIIAAAGWYLLQPVPASVATASTATATTKPIVTYTSAATFTPLPTPTLAPQPMIPPTATDVPFPSPGWTVTIPAASSLSVAMTNQATVAACGVRYQNLITLFLSVDGGKTFTLNETSIPGSSCLISIDPTNAQDLLLFAAMVTIGPYAGPLNGTLWRSQDGGAHFTAQTLPQQSTDPPFLAAIAWNGSTAYVSAGAQLAISVAGAAFTASKTPVTAQDIFPLNGAIVINAYCQQVCSGSYISHDNGATWTNLVPSVCPLAATSSPNTLFVVIAAPFDDKSLIGVCETFGQSLTYTLFRSTDGAQTWGQLPTLGNWGGGSYGFIGDISNFVAPDGTIYLTAGAALWKLTPGATTWNLALAGQEYGPIIAFAANTAGHPIAVWESRLPGLESHPVS